MNNTFGIGSKTIKAIHRMMGTKKRIKFTHISRKQVGIMDRAFNHSLLDAKDYKRFYIYKVQQHKKHKSWKGLRIIFGLPANGQRSKTNASTARRLRYKWDRLSHI